MKLKDYIKKLQKIAKERPDLDVVSASDEEGNNFRLVGFSPSLGNFCKGNFNDGDFISDDGSEEFKKEYGINAVCLN